MFKINSYFSPRLWGSQRLADYGFELPLNQKIGEAWVISGYHGKSSLITSGPYKNETLEWLWNNHRVMFNYDKTQDFPILAKIIDANKNLSIQVHPNNTQAQILERDPNARGKDECWYIIDSKHNDLIYGTHAKTKAQLSALVLAKDWDKILRNIKITKGDFYNIPAGTIHAITAGTLVYELQQSCDITYRFYDYDRLENGQPRELHIEKSLAVSCYDNNTTPAPTIKKIAPNTVVTKFLEGPYFGLLNLTTDAEVNSSDLDVANKAFLGITLLAGTAIINNVNFKRGESAILLEADIEALNIKALDSEIKLMVAWPN